MHPASVVQGRQVPSPGPVDIGHRVRGDAARRLAIRQAHQPPCRAPDAAFVSLPWVSAPTGSAPPAARRGSASGKGTDQRTGPMQRGPTPQDASQWQRRGTGVLGAVVAGRLQPWVPGQDGPVVGAECSREIELPTSRCHGPRSDVDLSSHVAAIRPDRDRGVGSGGEAHVQHRSHPCRGGGS